MTPISREQLAARKDSIGSSDIAAILGIHPNMTEADVWATKVFEVEPEQVEPSWFESGNVLEPAIIDWAISELNIAVPVEKNPDTYRKEPFFHANPDAVVMAADPSLIEAKTGAAGEWGEEGTDQVPAHVLAQVQWQLFVCDMQVCHVAAALASDYGIRLRLYRVERDEEIIDGLRKRGLEWWENHVVAHQRPGDTPPKLQILKRVSRRPDVEIEISELLVDAWAEAQNALRDAKKHEARCKAEVLESLGDAEGGYTEKWNVTYLEQSRKETKIPATTFRVLRKKRKKSKG